MRTIRQRLRRSQVRRSGDSDSISSRQQLKVNATPEDTSLPPDPPATPITNELRRRRMKLASLLYLEKWRLSHGVCEGGRSHGRNGVTLTTFPSSPLSRCHSSEKEGRVPSKYEPTSETPLRHAPRGDMFPSPDKEFIINGGGDESNPFPSTLLPSLLTVAALFGVAEPPVFPPRHQSISIAFRHQALSFSHPSE